MSSTPRLSLPFLSPGQAGKEFAHNEALQTIDIVLAGAVEQGPIQDPPSTPVVGACYILGSSPTGVWAGNPQYVAGWTSGGWRLVAPAEGMSVYVKVAGQDARYHNGAWEVGVLRGASLVVGGVQVVGGRGAAIPPPTGGATVDTQARTAINQILAALVQHGLIAS